MSKILNSKITTVYNLLNKNLIIPDYQRPYEWSKKSVVRLLEDILNANKESIKNNGDYKYGIGSVVLFKNKNNQYEIVDGQQRIITFLLINKYISKEQNKKCNFKLFNNKISNTESIKNIYNNYNVIKDWFTSKNDKKIEKTISKTINNTIELTQIIVDNIDLAFQIFQSQNSKSKPLEPHDLLKAFHLNEMKLKKQDGNKNKNIINKVKMWESNNPNYIKNLFEYYLYPIKNWINKKDSKTFSIQDKYEYEGITFEIQEKYNYPKSVKKGVFQIGEQFFSGDSFFNMVQHYIHTIDKLLIILKENYIDYYTIIKSCIGDELEINNIEKSEYYNVTLGLKYVCRLFFSSLLYYYDKFGIIDKIVLSKLFDWAFTLRIVLDVITLKSINRYALANFDQKNTKYKNKIPVFSIIKESSFHSTIYNIEIDINHEELMKAIFNQIKNELGDENE